MPRIIGTSVRVVDTGHLAIDELAGNVASKCDRISVAMVRITEPTEEPWLTIHYEEWICVLKGRIVVHYGEGKTLEVVAGQTFLIEKGERFRTSFPDGNTEYVPVCVPAFRPDRCIREDAPDGAVAKRLKALHSNGATAGEAKPGGKALAEGEEEAPEVLYHMCQKALWEKAKASAEAYFPPTFEADGFTHATAVASRLLGSANHFYQDVPGDWVCLRFRRSALRRLGIVTKDERAAAVGDKGVAEETREWVFPHVFGGIPPQVVEAVYPMLREGTKYTAIKGLTDVPQLVYKLASAQEVGAFKERGRVLSALDLKDGFVHLSDRNAVPVVAEKFFKECADLVLLAVDPARLPGPVDWLTGRMGDAEPKAPGSTTLVHYLKPDGCVHVYGDAGVPASAIVKEAPVERGADGSHRFPAWL